MKLHWQSLSHWLRPCSICGCVVRSHEFFCEHCELEFQFAKQRSWPHLNHHIPFEHQYLLRWNHSSVFITRMVSLLKGCECKSRLFKFLAHEFYGRENPVSNSESVIWVPAPAKVSQAPDHAYQLAVALKDAFGGEIQNVLYRESSTKEQKGLGLLERRQLQYGIHPEFILQNKRQYIFVDDILTTGASAMAAQRALKKPLKFVVYTIFWRPKRP